MADDPEETRIDALTLVVTEMTRSLRFYEAAGFRLDHGGPEASFSTLSRGRAHVNLTLGSGGDQRRKWGRVIFHVTDVDAFHEQIREAGLVPEKPPEDATWGERYFHLRDPDGHELSFATPLREDAEG